MKYKDEVIELIQEFDAKVEHFNDGGADNTVTICSYVIGDDLWVTVFSEESDGSHSRINLTGAPLYVVMKRAKEWCGK